ncbi:MAG: FG-GAP repeat protein, partial [Xanthomonadales bacterium]|nr:FG-GAP repeat protein [Xanthomonadales bacterium]
MTTAVLLLCVGWSAAASSSAADPLSDAEWASVRAQIEAHRHRAEGDAVDGYRAYNPVLGLSQRFHPDGRIQVEGQRLQVSMRLSGYGYGELVQPGRPELRAETDAQGAVVHYQWDRNLREWWHNRPGTLEQWFELQQRPAGADGSPLRLQMALTTSEQARVHLNATGQVLRVGEGEGALQYAGLKVWDADGQILPARMQLSEVDQLLLSVDDTKARYPLTIDPVWRQDAYFKASNAEQGDEFGYSVALSSSASGDTLVVGAPFEDGGLEGPGSNTSPLSGAVYVFVRLGGGQWLQQAYLKTSSIDGGGGDRFGEAVALSGETLVVGAPFERSRATGVNGDQLDNSRIESGAAYVFVRDGGMTGNWSQQAYLKASNTDFFDRFGSAVAVSGALVVVGAPGEGSSATGLNGDQSNNDAESSGAVYVFRRTQASGNWLQEAYLKASNTAAEDRFGSAVAIEGFTVIAGAPGEDSDATGINGDQANNGAGNSGAVYIFTRSELLVGDWSQQAYLKASNSGAGDAFGHALAISGESLVVGAIGEASNATGVNGNQSDNSAVNSGAAYVYARTGGVFGSWSQQAYLKASNAQTGDGFGHAVALSGNLLAVGAINEDSNARGIDGDQANNALGSSGAAYAFVREAGLWRPQAYIKASNTAFGNQFGYAVAVSGPRLVVGARAEGSSGIGVNGVQGPPNGAVASGAVYGFLIEPTLSATVSGLAPGGSLTLRNAGGGQTRVVTVNGPVSFGTLPFDSPYDVSVTVQPTGQFCTVANGSGHAVSEVTDIEVNCAVGSFFVGGNLVGLNAGQSISLRNTDSGDVLTLTANAFFSFPTLHGPGNTYNVVVTSQPIGQTCIVGNGTGVVVGPVTSVVVLCQTNTYRIGGRVTQLGPGDSLTLGNGSDTLVITENGDFVFPTRIPHGASYAVTITAEPVGKTCEVESGAGVALGDVSDVLVRCVVNDYSIGGTVSGLDPGRNITLRLPNATVVVNSNGPFSFPGQPISHGFPYSVTVQTQPVGQLCMVSNGSGVATGDVTDLIVDCITNRYSIGGTLFGLAAGGSLTLQNNGGDDLVLGTDGAFAFPTQLLHGSPYAVTVASAPAGQSCVVNPDTGTATGTV